MGSLKHDVVPTVAWELREHGFDVFDDWHAAGTQADIHWHNYEVARGKSFKEALQSPFANHAFDFDKWHIDDSDVGVLVMPAGKSGHLELGYMIGRGKRGYILMDKEPEGWDMMYKFAHGIFYDINQLVAEMHRIQDYSLVEADPTGGQEWTGGSVKGGDRAASSARDWRDVPSLENVVLKHFGLADE
jgi:hypothetical protein